MVESFNDAFYYLYLKKPTIINKCKLYNVRASSKVACLDLLSSCNLGTLNWGIPFDFLDSDELKVEWIRAFFDCECSVLRNQIQVRKLLEHFNISSQK
ncbi:hypothetical protein J4425_00085 [Candidatus Woesearchaeota archaeon]|nr:hypothetical protein [Candidatus Woesearchaeota archaeon]